MKSKAVLSQTEVATILAAARAEAQTNGWAVTIVVADDGGTRWRWSVWTAVRRSLLHRQREGPQRRARSPRNQGL